MLPSFLGKAKPGIQIAFMAFLQLPKLYLKLLNTPVDFVQGTGGGTPCAYPFIKGSLKSLKTPADGKLLASGSA